LHVAANISQPQAQQPASLLCPSDDARQRLFSWRSSTDGPENVPFAKGNYAAYTGPFHVDDYYTPGAIRPFGQQLRQVIDGVSQTLFLSEVRTRDNDRDQRGVWALPWTAASLLSLDAHPIWYDQAKGRESDIYSEFVFSPRSEGVTQRPNSSIQDVLYECPDPVAEQVERMPCIVSNGYLSASPRSNHAVGVNSAFLDGSVHFVHNDIDETVMAHLICISDGQVVQVPQ
jgi:hypothetical protein